MAEEPEINVWGVPVGKAAWADEVDEQEAKAGGTLDFPTLGEAIKEAPGGKKKKKPEKMSLGAFVAGSARNSRALSDKEILAQLPKGSSGLPKEERDPSALGGGFKYGGDREGGRSRPDREEREPSRADAVSDWGAERKFTPSEPGRGGGSGGFGGFRDRDGGSSFGERRAGGFGDRPPREERPVSEADTADDWGANRKFTPSAGSDERRGGGGGGGGGGFGSGFRDRPVFADRERGGGGGGFREGSRDEPSRADAGDWASRRGPPTGEQPGPSGRRGGYGFGEQPTSAADAEDRWSHRPQPAEAAGGSDSSAPAERPRLKLAPRTKPLEQPPAAAGAGAAAAAAGSTPNGTAPGTPTSEAGSASSGQQQQQQAAQQAPPKARSNPFGAARPREEVLREKGIDYQKEALKLEHGEVIRDKSPEEAAMEAEVEQLRLRLEGMRETALGETDTIAELAGELDGREKALYKLQAELDDRVRYSKSLPQERQERERSSEPAGGRAAPAAAAAAPAAAPVAAAAADEGFTEVSRSRRGGPAAGAGAGGGGGADAGGERPPRDGSRGGEPAGGGGGGGAWGRGGGFRGGSSFRDREGRPGPGGRGGEGGRGDRRPGPVPGRGGSSGGW